MKFKKIATFICILLLVISCGCKKDKTTDAKSQSDNRTYRNVKVIELVGNAILTRNSKQQSVYKQMLINGGDNIVTDKNSTVDLLLDSDKYARIYENTEVGFELEGDASKGAIRLYLNKGGINNRIENKLSADDSYEVHTPDAVMAVRGTEFEVTVTDDGSLRQTKVTTFSGSVEITLSDDSGARLNEAGETAVIEVMADSSGNMGKPEFKDGENDTLPPQTDTTSSKTENPPSNSYNPPEKQPTVSVPPTAETTVKCTNCGKAIEKSDSHLLSCNEGHYSCDGKDHSVCSECQKNVCDSSTHVRFECKTHYRCILNNEEAIEHEMLCVVCKDYVCNLQNPHFWADCGCVSCVDDLGASHITCELCGRCKSENITHEECGFCYSCVGNGEKHGDGVCNTEQFPTSSS